MTRSVAFPAEARKTSSKTRTSIPISNRSGQYDAKTAPSDIQISRSMTAGETNKGGQNNLCCRTSILGFIVTHARRCEKEFHIFDSDYWKRLPFLSNPRTIILSNVPNRLDSDPMHSLLIYAPNTEKDNWMRLGPAMRRIPFPIQPGNSIPEGKLASRWKPC